MSKRLPRVGWMILYVWLASFGFCFVVALLTDAGKTLQELYQVFAPLAVMVGFVFSAQGTAGNSRARRRLSARDRVGFVIAAMYAAVFDVFMLLYLLGARNDDQVSAALAQSRVFSLLLTAVVAYYFSAEKPKEP